MKTDHLVILLITLSLTASALLAYFAVLVD
jgi:hypothetical protein